MKVPDHLVERGLQAIIRRREAETGYRLVVVASPDDPQPVSSSASSDIDRRDNREGEGA